MGELIFTRSEKEKIPFCIIFHHSGLRNKVLIHGTARRKALRHGAGLSRKRIFGIYQ